jgi:pimeloyl-ACP methyl ester carboxylesterase
LFDALPAEVRDRVRAVARTYDPASVAATTAFMASGVQPFERGEQLAVIDVPTLLIPGTDPYHPAEVADVFRRHVKECVVIDAELPGYADAIARFVLDGDASA